MVPMLAQTVRGTIHGILSDSSQKPVAGASIEIRNEDTGRISSVTTARTGLYLATSLVPGNYRVTAKQADTVALKLEVNQEVRVDLTLADVARKDQVTVSSVAGLLKTESASVSGVISTQQIQGLPLDGRNFYELGLLLPGDRKSVV